MRLDEFMLGVLIVLILVGFMFVETGCTTISKGNGAPLKSICLMDYDANKCWTSKSKGEGYDFETMKQNTEACLENSEQSCWYGINSADLKRLINK